MIGRNKRYALIFATMAALPGSVMADIQTVPSAVSFAASHQSGKGNSFSAPFQWYKIRINQGATITAKLASVSAGDSVYLRLYPPGTTDGRQQHSAEENTRTKTLTYTAPRAGDYLLRVFSFSSGDTAYTFTWSAGKLQTDAGQGAPPIPVTGRSDLSGRWVACRNGAKVADCRIEKIDGRVVLTILRSPQEQTDIVYIDDTTFVAKNWDGQRGKVSQDGRRIDWSNSYWVRAGSK